MYTCTYCDRPITPEESLWVDPEATGDDSLWRDYCPDNETERRQPHEPAPQCNTHHDTGDETP